MPPPAGEERLRERLAARDFRGAATGALRAYGPAILRYLRSLLRDEEDAADAFSGFAEAFWESLPGFRGESSLRTWAYRVAWSAARNLRDEAWRRRVRRLQTSEVSAIANEVRTTSAAAIEERQQALDTMRMDLSLDEQALLVLRIDQKLSWAEIANVLSEANAPITPAALMKRFERLKQRLTEAARERGLIE